jgi:hypothetical protein
MIKCSNKFDLITTNDAKFDSINGKRLTVMVTSYIGIMSRVNKNKIWHNHLLSHII